jgi:poly(hydroxyalkanoate) granule-associated protein
MVKKFKAMADTTAADNHLAAAIKDSAQQIWLAGLGAFAKAQDEGSKMFETLVKEGGTIQRRTKKMAEARVGEVTGKVTKVAGEFSKQATEGWDKLEQVFEDRVARALNRLGVPTNKDIQALIARVEELNGNVSGVAKKPSRKQAAKVVKSTKAVAKASTKAVKSTATKSAKAVVAKVTKVAKVGSKAVVKAMTPKVAKPKAAAKKAVVSKARAKKVEAASTAAQV